jgi:hypothetical protein
MGRDLHATVVFAVDLKFVAQGVLSFGERGDPSEKQVPRENEGEGLLSEGVDVFHRGVL